jgi:hypothetical protein
MLPSFVVLRCLLPTSPCIDVALAFVLIYQCSYTSEFDLVCLMESLVALLFNVVITIPSFLFSSSPCYLFFMDFPLCPEHNIYRNIALLNSLWNYLSNVWSFIENGVQTGGLCPYYFSAACCPKLISGHVALSDSDITACRNLRLSWFLICWNRNFIWLLNIQKYPVFFLWDHA